MIGQVRVARPSITLDGRDYYSELAPYLVSFTFTDNCDGKKGDDLQIELADRDKRFINDWMPKKGAFVDAGIQTERWFSPIASNVSLECGRFWIDSIEFELPAHTVTVKANSIPTNVRIKASTETRGWEKANLKDIATQIAGESKMSVDWQADNNPRYSRTEQHEESALSFLQKRAQNAKLAIKVSKNKIVVYDEQKMEDAEAKFTLLYGNATAASFGATYRMAGGTFTTTIADTTKKCKVKHTDVESGEVHEGEAEDSDESDDAEGGDGEEHTQNINEDSDSDDDSGDGIGDPSFRAEEGSASQYNADDTAKAKSVVRDKNKHKFVGKIQMSLGNPLVAAGMTFNLKGVGQYDGKWFIDSAHHELGPAYNTELTCHRCLQGL
jgi:Bacteriophage probable baseplate hub protein